MSTILIADSDPSTIELTRATDPEGRHRMLSCEDASRALDLLVAEEVDLVIADYHLAGLPGPELLAHLQRTASTVQVVLVAAFGSIEDAVQAMHAGANDFLSKPFTQDQLGVTIERSLETAALRRENQDLREALDDRLRIDNFVATDPQMQQIFKAVRAVATTRTTVLLTGESGTGKTRLARAIHAASDRAAGAFVEVNCGALPESLLESELFGHVRGAFTGAVKDRQGKFEAADGGTIFLDEIGTATPALQVKLLRVLQDKIIERVGDARSLPVDVRVVLATNLDLTEEVREGRFREDLFYRIHVIALEVPPLRERRGDIELLADHFLRRFAQETGRQVHGFSRGALEALRAAAWPGNVRQLENVVERAIVLCEGELVQLADLPPDLAMTEAATDPTPESMLAPSAHLLPLRDAMLEPERRIIERALEHFDGNRQKTALSLGVNRSTLFNKMRRLGIS